MELVKITPLDLLSENDVAKTWAYESLSPSKGRILAYRAKGSISGNHWHKGNSVAKDPEELLLISGETQLSLKHFESKDFQEVLTLKGPCLIHINKDVFHQMEALSDIMFLESNSIEEHQSDTFYPS